MSCAIIIEPPCRFQIIVLIAAIIFYQGITTYALSPFEQKPFAGVSRAMIFNTSRRVSAQIPYIGVAFGIGYGIYTWANARHEYLLSKAGHAEAAGH
jgi:ubiquinol-cytochrome c reductase subunit 8